MLPNLLIEKQYAPNRVIGIDEAGRGPLAGPVVAAAVYIHNEPSFKVNDSKKLSKVKRDELYNLITTNYKYSVAIVDHAEIDRINILQATMLAMKLAAEKMELDYSVVLVDGNKKPAIQNKTIEAIVKGDSKSFSIAAASIVAKVTRDRLMEEMAIEFPMYNWTKNMGYGTAEHMELIKLHGLCKYHRKSFTRKIAA